MVCDCAYLASETALLPATGPHPRMAGCPVSVTCVLVPRVLLRHGSVQESPGFCVPDEESVGRRQRFQCQQQCVSWS
jgi:hypothetical protein